MAFPKDHPLPLVLQSWGSLDLLSRTRSLMLKLPTHTNLGSVPSLQNLLTTINNRTKQDIDRQERINTMPFMEK